MTADTPEQLPAPTLTPMALLDKALDNKIPADQLGSLIDLAEKWRKARAKEAFCVAMNKAQAEMVPVIKTQPNPHTGSMYAPLDSVVEMCRPVYTRNGFSVSFGQSDGAPEGLIRFVALVRHRDGYDERWQGDYPRDGEGAKGGRSMNPVQGVVSSGSYMQRDMLRLIFNIAMAGADSDGNRPDENAYLDHDQLAWVDQMLGITRIPLGAFLEWLEAKTLDQIRAADWLKAADHLRREAGKLKKTFPPPPGAKNGGPKS